MSSEPQDILKQFDNSDIKSNVCMSVLSEQVGMGI